MTPLTCFVLWNNVELCKHHNPYVAFYEDPRRLGTTIPPWVSCPFLKEILSTRESFLRCRFFIFSVLHFVTSVSLYWSLCILSTRCSHFHDVDTSTSLILYVDKQSTGIKMEPIIPDFCKSNVIIVSCTQNIMLRYKQKKTN